MLGTPPPQPTDRTSSRSYNVPHSVLEPIVGLKLVMQTVHPIIELSWRPMGDTERKGRMLVSSLFEPYRNILGQLPRVLTRICETFRVGIEYVLLELSHVDCQRSDLVRVIDVVATGLMVPHSEVSLMFMESASLD